ncbi:SDR family oxidoreductase [Pediococcus pentosaceus]|uniref:SDR family oxidoreductase n=1 Tax=Pediococcus pentosaceus TaxID=1255 RepID=UPI00211C8AFE|nr:SDR family oxidoreductase [Pediococcus pentosaceus]MCQ9316475.1 SDR family oxidoreductase [Pediococcus pentosaceus]MCQ9338964.1 SDR family oxidoreductase [Pediococcus pentosaceus]
MTKKVLILGAHGKIARLSEKEFLEKTDDSLKLFLRKAGRLNPIQPDREVVIEGDATNLEQLVAAMQGVDAVYANLAGGDIKQQAQAVVKAMDKVGIKRLVWISTLGIYDEVPGKFGEWNNSTLGSYITNYRAAADVIEDSDLDYTIVRPAWLTNNDEVDFEVTQKGEVFKGTEVSRKSIAHIVVELIQNNTELKHSIGVNKPNTDGDKPSWY